MTSLADSVNLACVRNQFKFNSSPYAEPKIVVYVTHTFVQIFTVITVQQTLQDDCSTRKFEMKIYSVNIVDCN